MKKFVALALALVLVFSMGVPSFATDVTVTESGVFDDIYSGTVNDTVYTTRNPLEMIILFLQGISDRLGLMGGSLTSIVDKITTLSGYFTFEVSEISDYGNGNMYDMMSTFAYLGREIQGMNYYTPYSGGQATSLDEALNKNLLYIQNQLQVISDSMGATSSSSGLMSGWNMSGVPSPEGYDSSWYRRILMNLYSFRLDFTRLFDGTWADSENYGDSFFYQTYMQNYGLLENSELFENIFLEKKFQYFMRHPQTGQFVSNSGDYSTAITGALYSISTMLLTTSKTTFENPFSSTGETVVNAPGGMFYNMLLHLNHQNGFLARLAYVLADDEEIRLNETIQDSKTEVVDFVGNGITSSNGSSFSLVSGITDGIGFVTDFNEIFSIPDVGLGDIFKVFDDTSESLSWFTEETASNIDTVPVTYSRESNPQTEIVTSYYEDRQAEFAEMWGEIIG